MGKYDEFYVGLDANGDVHLLTSKLTEYPIVDCRKLSEEECSQISNINGQIRILEKEKRQIMMKGFEQK